MFVDGSDVYQALVQSGGNPFDFTEVAGPHMPVPLQHGEDLCSVVVFFEVGWVIGFAAILWGLSCFVMTANACVLR